MLASKAKSCWRIVAIGGLALIVLGIGWIASAVATSTLANTILLARFSGVVLLAILVGVLGHSAGLIGWAAMLEKSGRERLAIFAVVFPLSVVAMGYFLAQGDMHGTFALFWLPMLPLVLVAFVLSFMAGFFSFRRD